MLFFRMPSPEASSTAMESTADGMAETIVMPAKRPGYEFAAARSVASRMARTGARADSCGIGRCAGAACRVAGGG
jgi:hypothetical protein